MKELDEIVNRSKSQFRTEVAKIVGSNLDTKIEIWKILNVFELNPFRGIILFGLSYLFLVN